MYSKLNKKDKTCDLYVKDSQEFGKIKYKLKKTTYDDPNIIQKQHVKQFVYKPYYYPYNESPYFESIYRRVDDTKYWPRSDAPDPGFDKQYYFIDEGKQEQIEGFSNPTSSYPLLSIVLIILLTILFFRNK